MQNVVSGRSQFLEFLDKLKSETTITQNNKILVWVGSQQVLINRSPSESQKLVMITLRDIKRVEAAIKAFVDAGLALQQARAAIQFFEGVSKDEADFVADVLQDYKELLSKIVTDALERRLQAKAVQHG